MKYVFNPFTGTFDLVVTTQDIISKIVTYEDAVSNDLATLGSANKYVGIVVDNNGEVVFT